MGDLRLILSLLCWAMTLGVAGGLVDLTINMAHHAWQADHVGLVSMRSLTHQLMSPDSTVRELKARKHLSHP